MIGVLQKKTAPPAPQCKQREQAAENVKVGSAPDNKSKEGVKEAGTMMMRKRSSHSTLLLGLSLQNKIFPIRHLILDCRRLWGERTERTTSFFAADAFALHDGRAFA